jgi:acetoacetyl-CoA synthetase
MPGARWYDGAALNYAENLLAGRNPDQLAILASSELRELEEITWGELTHQVTAAAAGLRELGVKQGDRVAAYMPNVAETVIAFLATTSIGAIWSSAAPEFGPRSVIDRFAQIEPRVLIAADGYRHAGKDFDRRDQVAAVVAELPSVEHVVLLSYLHAPGPPAPQPLAGRPVSSWEQLLASSKATTPSYEQVSFEHPLWVLYSSGTTGLPKAIVHGHGGILLEQRKHLLHLDLQPGDRMFWFTTTGWMMWNYLVGCLLSDAAIVLFDGSPSHPDLNMLWALAERASITCMGFSPGLMAAMEKAHIEPARDHDLSSLRAIGSSGSPLQPESYSWVREHVGADTWLFSMSGGTDVCTAFVTGCPILPVYSGEIQCRALGCAVEAWDGQGRSVVDQVGELVLTKPMPSMPLYLWGDESGEQLRDSYFATYPGVWRHGDWIQITAHGGAVIQGRSDSTINRHGVRMGTSEIYRATNALPAVLDSLVVDVPTPASEGGEAELRMILFVVLRDGLILEGQLKKEIQRRIREDCSPRHVPDEIRQIGEVPRTLSGKILEVPVKRILMGTPPSHATSIESLANPAALDYFEHLSVELTT